MIHLPRLQQFPDSFSSLRKLLALFAALALVPVPATAVTQLKSETRGAFERYIRLTDQQMDRDWKAGRFLAVDRLPASDRERVYAQLQQGQLYIENLKTLDEAGKPLHAPSGLIHDWVGIVFIRGATRDQALRLLEDYDSQAAIFSPDVRSARILEKNGNLEKVLVQYYQRSLVTVTFNVNFDVESTDFAPNRVQSRACSTRIAEVADAGKPTEHELPVENDHGYMWRLYSYWRIEEKDGGVYIQNESIELSRSIPVALAWIVGPLTKSIPRDVLGRLLEKSRMALLREQPDATPAAASR